MTRSCTVVGIVETVSDRWDVGDVVLPNCYMSAPTAEEFRETAAQLQTREEPRLQRPLEEQTLLFLRGNGALSSLYGQVREMGIPLVREVSVDAYYRSMDSDAWKSDDGYEVEERDWEIAQWQLEEMQKTDPVSGWNLPDWPGAGFQSVLCGLAGTDWTGRQSLQRRGLPAPACVPMGAQRRLHPVGGWVACVSDAAHPNQ